MISCVMSIKVELLAGFTPSVQLIKISNQNFYSNTVVLLHNIGDNNN